MKYSAKEMIKNRRSIRTFNGEPLKAEDKAKLEEHVRNTDNPWNVPIEFRILDASENGLSSPVIKGENTYLAAKVAREDLYEVAFGYSFEEACLYAESLGLGTVMLAASLSREAFEKVMGLKENEVFPLASPVGYPSDKQTLLEKTMRKALKADKRLAFDEVFFDGDFGKGLSEDKAGVFAEALEMARWAPSAGNKQPWRAVVSGNKVHFYEEKSMKASPLGDVQKIDVGIAICHLHLIMKEKGVKGSFVDCNPGIEAPKNTYYITSFVIVDADETN
ncbi:MAG: nitroreductase family protein [Mogibacterium sp.]|nr:nitroreductase family protein [Mogibacterium sp.]